MRCSRCQHENPSTAKFCAECAAPLVRTCANCGAQLLATAKFCPECAHPVGASSDAKPRFTSPESYAPRHLAEKILTSKAALEGERKQVTVFFCDIANSTRLAERVGAEAMHGLLNRFFELALAEVHRYEGTINQFLGDGFMALFGAPLAHEDHARRAVLAASAIQRALHERRAGDAADLTVRMGLNTGPVVVGAIGDNLRMDYTAVGDTTHLAARLQQLAEPGSVYLSEHTHHLVRAYADCQPLGTRTVKGKAEPVAIYRLLGVRAHAEPIGSRPERGIGAPLVGREPEVAGFLECLDQLRAGRGSVVSVVGGPGLGKSRLVAEVRKRSQDLRWLEGRALSFGQTMSYWPFLEIIRTAVEITEHDDADESWTKLERRLTALFPGELAEVLPYLATLLGLEVRPEFADRVKYLDAQAIGRQIFRATRRFFERLAQERPLALVFEDWHWADQSSAAVLEHLVPLVDTVPLLICWAGRPDPDTPATRLGEFVRQKHSDRHAAIALSPLSPADSAVLVENLLDIADLPRLQELILRKAEGNPFFMEEVVRSLIAMGAVIREESTGAWRVTAHVDQITVPDTLQGVIMARVDRLDEDTKQILKLASVIGRSFFHRVLQATAEAGQELDQHLAHLQQLELIREKRRLPELEYIFKHALVQEATYESILADRRRQLHLRVAECIVALFPDRLDEFSSLLAYHFARAEEWEKAQEYLFRAGDEAGRVAADAETLAHYERAIAAYARAFGDRWDPVQRAVLERKMGEALFRRGEHRQAHDYLRRALHYLRDPYPTSPWRTRLRIAKELVRQARHRVLPGVFVGGKPHAGDSTVAEERSRIYFSLCWIDYFADQERLLLDALAISNLSERSGSPVGVPLGFAWISALCNVIPHFRLASYYSRRAVALADHIQHPIPVSVAHHLAAFHRYYVGDWTGAVEHYRRSIAAYRQTGDLRGWAAINGFMYGLCRYRGRYSESLEQAAELIRVGQESADHHAWGWGLQILGFIEGRAGPVDHVIGHLQRALELFRAIPAYPSVAEALGDLGHCYLAQGEWKQALTVLEECHQLIRARGLRGHEVTSPYHALAEAYLAATEHSQGAARATALHRAQNACRVALKHGAAFVGGIPRAMRLQGTCSWLSNQPAAAEKWWRRGLAVAENLGASYDLGMTYMEMGTRLQDRHHLERAADLFREIGATRDLGTAYRLLGEAVLGTSQLETGALDAAAPYFEKSTSILSAIKAEYELALAYTGYARLRERQGRLAEAHDHRTRALDIFARLGTPIEPDEARAELAELPSG